jgi:hypothetical protein
MLWKVEQNRYMKWLYTLTSVDRTQRPASHSASSMGGPHPSVVVTADGTSDGHRPGKLPAPNILCLWHPRPPPPFSSICYTSPFLSLFAGRLRVHYSWLSCVTTSHHWYLNFPKHNVCLSKLAWGITRLALMTCHNLWLSTRQPYLLSMSFSQSNLAVKIQRAEVLRAQPCG